MTTNHFDEITCLLFLEGQLDSAESLAFDSHLAGCADCRALLRVLQQESLLLSNSLREEDAPLPARLRNAPWQQSPQPHPQQHSPAHATWLPWAWALSFALAAASCFIAWTDILAPWSDQLDQNGIHSSGLLIQLAMSTVFWEGWTTMLNTLQYAVLALIGATIAIGAFALLRGRSRHHRQKLATVGVLLAGLAVVLGLPAPASAADIRHGSDVNVPVGETVQNDLIAAGETVRIDGTVNGNLIAAGQNVTINGRVVGDIIAFAGEIRISGPVEGNVICFCNTLTLDNTTEKSLIAFANHVEVNPSSIIKGGIIAFANNFIAEGKVGRDLLFFASDTTLNGSVGGDVRLRGGRFSIGPMAQVSGRIHVISDRQLEMSQSAKLAQPPEFELAAPPGPRRRALAGLSMVHQAVRYGVAFLIGLLMIMLFPGIFPAVSRSTRRVGLSLGVGALLLAAGFPLLLFSILLVLTGGGAGFAALMLYIPVLYASQLFIGAWIGQRFLSRIAKSAVGQLALGLLIIYALGMIPFLGFFVWAAVFIWGTGAIAAAIWEATRPAAPPAPAIA